MKEINKFYIFLIAAATLFWNPLTFFIIYRHTVVYTDKLIMISVWAASIMGIVAIIALLYNRLERFKNISLAFALAGIALSFFIVLDGAIGLISGKSKTEVRSVNLIFEANSSAQYSTSEFRFLSKINSFGLRNKEFDLAKGNKFRILCLGDSWTYGWGVNNDLTWPERLEVYLKNNGYQNAEVINCGESGQYPGAYQKIAARLIPLLKPDMVIAGILQGDDLAQCYELADSRGNSNTRTNINSGVYQSFNNFFRISFENIVIKLRANRNKTYNVRAEWKNNSTQVLAKFNNLQKKRFETLDDTVKTLIRSGNLNPGLLYYYLYFPDRFYVFNNTANKATQKAISLMKENLDKTNRICKKYKARLIFVNLPEPSLTGHKTQNLTDVLQNEYLLDHNHFDSVYSAIASDLHLPYLEMTSDFRSFEEKSGYFYYYDGHPTAKGYNEMANAIGQFLVNGHFVK